MDSSAWFNTKNNNLGWYIVYQGMSQVIIKRNIACLSLKIIFVLANTVDLDEMSHCVAFHNRMDLSPQGQNPSGTKAFTVGSAVAQW